MTTKRLLTMALTGLGVLAPAAADAACTINTTAVNFATYNVFSATPDDATGQIRFRCTGSPPPVVTIHLDKGGAPSFTPREMRRGSEILGYNLYLDSTRTTIWGDGTGGSQAFIQSGPPLNVNIDLNVFVPVDECEPVLAALPPGVAHDAASVEAIRRDGQVRLWWGYTPVDLFFDYVPLHADAARNRRTVPFAGTRIPVLGPVELAVFKAMFDRTRDWADIEAMVAASSLDVDAVRELLVGLLPEDDERFARLDEAVQRGAAAV